MGDPFSVLRVENAVFFTLAEGRTVTRDIVGDARAAGTRAFTEAIIANLGKAPAGWKPRDHRPLRIPARPAGRGAVATQSRRVVGIDVFLEADQSASQFGGLLTPLAEAAGFQLKMSSNRGTQVFPARGAETDCVDHWRCRFLDAKPGDDLALAQVNQLLGSLQTAGLRWMHLEKLQEFNGKPAFTKAQGED